MSDDSGWGQSQGRSDGWGNTTNGNGHGDGRGEEKNGGDMVDSRMSEGGASGLISNDFQVEVS
jgi:hypothetical protein